MLTQSFEMISLPGRVWVWGGWKTPHFACHHREVRSFSPPDSIQEIVRNIRSIFQLIYANNGQKKEKRLRLRFIQNGFFYFITCGNVLFNSYLYTLKRIWCLLIFPVIVVFLLLTSASYDLKYYNTITDYTCKNINVQ